MLKVKYLSFIILIPLFFGCFKKHHTTRQVCDKLYVETFLLPPADIAEYYLTDSLTFRMFLGKLDNEHEGCAVTCKGDSVIVEKFTSLSDSALVIDKDTVNYKHIIETRVFNLHDLKKQSKFE